MKLGENIRRIRQERGMTQSALAEALGVSDRAISRWERNAAAPDVTLLARLAQVLETSADALLDVDPQRIRREILAATDECTRLLNAGEASAAAALLREKSALYPNQPELMVYLARALLAMKSEESLREALSLCRAAQACGLPMRLSTTYGCKQVMALCLSHLGRKEEAARLVEDEMPAIFVSRELLLPRVAPPERARLIRRSNVTLLGELLISNLEKLSCENAKYGKAVIALKEALSALP